ncbi:MAG: GGDEF domain-containing protein [Azoarcus sp.]|nr:GGDEF domain-containing protein [Azoarcus sp.]
MSPEILSLALTLILGLAIGFYAGQVSARRSRSGRPADDVVPARTSATQSEAGDLARKLAERTREAETLRAKLASNERQLRDEALTDPLTGIGNGMLLSDRIDHAITRGRRHNARLGIIVLDLEEFGAINESLGRKVGDRLLVEVARKLREAVRAEDTVAHVHGDRFAIALEGVFEREDLERGREAVQRVFAEPFVLDDKEVELKARMGSALFPTDGENSETLLRAAENQLSIGRKRAAQKSS